MIPRKSELDAVVAVLTATDDREFLKEVTPEGEAILVPNPDFGEPLYDDESSMAKACVKAVAAELLQRELYTIVPQGQPFGYGPYWTRTEAEKAWTKQIGPSVGEKPAGLLRVFPWSPPEDRPSNAPCVCGHEAPIHVVRNQRGGKTSKPTECGITTCTCSNYQEAS